MKILLVHQNFPGQYLHLVRHLAADPAHQVVFITQRRDGSYPGVHKIVYAAKRSVTPETHHYLKDTEASVLNAQAVASAALGLRKSGFIPDIILGHNGWGEIWYLKDVFPRVPLIGYFEFFYSLHGADVGFDPTVPTNFDTGPRIRTKNIGNLLGLDLVDAGQCPTQWQKSRYPERYHSMLHVIHEGIDTDIVKPNEMARLRIPEKNIELSSNDEVVTYVARNLEPYRGFTSFMHSLPEILAKRPNAHVVIVGGDATSYGPSLPNGVTFRAQVMQEIGSSIDVQRVHFMGKVPYRTYLTVLQISSAHVYLTYPFVLSWSMLEAMSAGCVVIGSKTAPVEEVVRHEGNGLLVDFFSPSEIAERVIDVLREKGAFASMKENARRTAIQNYDLRTVCLPKQLRMLERYSTASKKIPIEAMQKARTSSYL